MPYGAIQFSVGCMWSCDLVAGISANPLTSLVHFQRYVSDLVILFQAQVLKLLWSWSILRKMYMILFCCCKHTCWPSHVLVHPQSVCHFVHLLQVFLLTLMWFLYFFSMYVIWSFCFKHKFSAFCGLHLFSGCMSYYYFATSMPTAPLTLVCSQDGVCDLLLWLRAHCLLTLLFPWSVLGCGMWSSPFSVNICPDHLSMNFTISFMYVVKTQTCKLSADNSFTFNIRCGYVFPFTFHKISCWVCCTICSQREYQHKRRFETSMSPIAGSASHFRAWYHILWSFPLHLNFT